MKETLINFVDIALLFVALTLLFLALFCLSFVILDMFFDWRERRNERKILEKYRKQLEKTEEWIRIK